MATIRQYRLSKEEFERARAEEAYMYAVRDFWYDHHDEFMALYPELYVAVKDPLGDYEVVATDTTMLSLIDALDAQGYDRDEIEIERVTDRISAPLGLLLKPR